MRIIRGFKNIKSGIEPCVLTIGNFDGVHLGHQKIIEKVTKKAQEKGLKSAVLTFFPHPIKFFKQDFSQNFLIFNLAQKLKFFKQYSLDYVFVLPFNQDLASVRAHNFVENILLQNFNMKELVIGYDFIFGKNREGNFAFLEKESQRLGYSVSKVEALENDGIVYSSTKIRDFVKAGKITKANEILGKNFEVEGVVVNGRKLARTIGFPTLNLLAKPHLIKPKFGVYKSEVFVPFLGENFKSITNFGVKPTIAESLAPTFETHIVDYDGKNSDILNSLYGKKIVVKLIDFVREERKFASVDELKKQIAIDLLQIK